MKKFAMLGKWHVHAEQYANELNTLEGCTVSKVWDKDEATAKAWAEKLDAEAATLEDILSDPEIEGVAICTATNEHPEILLKAVRSGKAVFTEKVLTLKTKDAEAVEAEIEKYHTRFAISFPHLCESATMFCLDAAANGRLGTLNYARVRKAHNGATADWLPPHFYDPIACGGGAMIDLGAHPMYLLCHLLGEPVRVQSAFTKVTGKPVEDNAVSLLTFANGAVGVSETSFVSEKYPLIIELGGTKGNLLMRDKKVEICCEDNGYVWQEAELPERLLSPVKQWALADKPEDIPEGFGIKAAVRLTKVMEAAYAE